VWRGSVNTWYMRASLMLVVTFNSSSCPVQIYCYTEQWCRDMYDEDTALNSERKKERKERKEEIKKESFVV